MNRTPLHTALVVCDQLSPMPNVAHEALLTLRTELVPHLGYEKFVADYWRGRRREDPEAPVAADGHATSEVSLVENLRDLFIMSVGLGGETGEVQELLKKHVRDGHIDVRALALELGAVLYYLTKIAQRYGLTLATLKRLNREKLEARREGGKGAYTAASVVLDLPATDWTAVMRLQPSSVAKDLRRAASFVDGTDPECNVVDEPEAARLAQVLRELARAGERGHV